MPTTLGGVRVLINGTAAPLLYASDQQINAVVPYGVAGLSTAQIQVVNQGSTGPAFRAVAIAADPAIFAGALNQDGTINSAANPAKPGSIVSLWATGIYPGPAYAVPDGQIVTSANQYGGCGVYAGNQGLYAPYVGAAPGLVSGVTQINVQLPATGGGNLTLVCGGMTTGASVHVSQ
jgi:uncharacterized protein (TIGR03437 family)